jgi:hypothetical protein
MQLSAIPFNLLSINHAAISITSLSSIVFNKPDQTFPIVNIAEYISAFEKS